MFPEFSFQGEGEGREKKSDSQRLEPGMKKHSRN